MTGKFYLDLTTASPGTKEKAAAVVAAAGGIYIDGAIMGPLKKQHHKVSTLISGKKADELALSLNQWGMDIRSLGSKVGLASTIKMIRSVYTKGLEAIVLEFALAAYSYGVTEPVLESLEEILELGPFLLPFRKMVAELILEQVEHAERRADEMEQVVRTLEELGINPSMAGSTLKLLRWEAEDIRLREKFAGESPANYEEVLEKILTVRNKTN